MLAVAVTVAHRWDQLPEDWGRALPFGILAAVFLGAGTASATQRPVLPGRGRTLDPADHSQGFRRLRRRRARRSLGSGARSGLGSSRRRPGRLRLLPRSWPRQRNTQRRSDNPSVLPRVEYLLTAAPLAIIITSMVLDSSAAMGAARGEVTGGASPRRSQPVA